jgi:protein-S-isoprenylcysteine O-methyltransferase Ste14
VTVLALVPFIFLYCSGYNWRMPPPWAMVVGLLLFAIGLALAVATTGLFHRRGGGTAAPWDPPAKLVTAGPYGYVRNPMICGVFAMLAGEVLIFESIAILLWMLLFVCAKAVYIPLVEEPKLAARFGDAYREYKLHVPRWIPRLTPWSRK